ncbi:MAG: hypothetical protein ABFS41_02090 [Myxococcota bacterium]
MACATTHIVERWTAPGLTAADLEFQHVIAIAAVPEPSRQRLVEDALARAATRTRVTPAYTILEPEHRADVEQLRTVLERHGIDGAITVRLVGVEETQTYVPPAHRYAGGYYGYYGAVGPRVYQPGYVVTDTHVVVETSLYDVAGGRMLWTGISRTFNPGSVDDLIGEIAIAARNELRDEGLLP